MPRYKHTARCPVCKTVLDVITTPTKELEGMAEALILGEPRREHGVNSPKCTEHKDWYKGWIIDDPVEESKWQEKSTTPQPQ